MQRIYNYGSFLQAYALKKMMEECGAEVEFVDYHPGECILPSKETTGMKRKIQKGLEILRMKGRLRDKIQFVKYKKNYARKNYPGMYAVAFVMNESEIADAVANPIGMVASDGILNNGNGHPRAAGTFPRVLGKYVREEGRLDLITALKKMTLEPAKRLEIDHRKGIIKEGADADITIFDPDTIIDGPEFGNINVPNRGIDYVIVNGKIAVKDNQMLTQQAGKFISYFEK